MAAYTEGVFSGTPRQFLDKIIAFCTHANVGYTLTEAVTGYGTNNEQWYHCTLSKTVTVYGKTNTIYIGLAASGTSPVGGDSYEQVAWAWRNGPTYTGITIFTSSEWVTGYRPDTQPTRVLTANGLNQKTGLVIPSSNMPFFMASDGNAVFIGTTNISSTSATPSTPRSTGNYWCAAINPSIGGDYVGGQFLGGHPSILAGVLATTAYSDAYLMAIGSQIPYANAPIDWYMVSPSLPMGALKLIDSDYVGYDWCGLVSPIVFSEPINSANRVPKCIVNAKCPGNPLGRTATTSIGSDNGYNNSIVLSTLPLSTRTGQIRADTLSGYYNLSKWTGAFMPNDIHIYVNRLSNEKMVAAGTLPIVKNCGYYLSDFTQDITLSDGIAYKVCGANLVEKTGTQITI